MTPTLIPARQGYNKRAAPSTYSKGWLDVEFGNVQRGSWLPTSRSVFADYAAQTIDNLIVCDATSGAFTVSLPTPDQAKDLLLTIKKIDGGANAVTIGATVDGVANPTLATQWKSLTVQSDGASWYKLASV